MLIDNSSEQMIAERLLKKIIKINRQEWGILDKVLAKKGSNLDLSLRKEIKHSLIKAISSRTLKNILSSKQFKESTFLRKFLPKAVVERTDISSKDILKARRLSFYLKGRDLFMELLGLQTFYNDLTKMNEEKRMKLVRFLIQQLEEDKDLESIVNRK